MIDDVLSQIRRIFVGRHSELRRLKGLWNLACQDEEHLVYVLLNAPGVGKTTLINHFGEKIEKKGKGLFIRLRSSKNANTPLKIKKEVLSVVQKAIKQKRKVIEKYWYSKSIEIDIEDEKKDLQKLKKKINDIFAKSQLDLYDIYDILNGLSNIVPIFFAVDEIQEFQKIIFKQTKDGKTETETALHYFTQILRDLLDSRILLILSGTRYHILSQIGGDLGSPIRQKVKPLIIQKFEKEEILAYINEVKKLIDMADLKEKSERIPSQLENYQKFLFGFSGGHPRTIENITDHFLNYLPYLIADTRYSDYNAFVNFFLPKIEEFFKNSLLSSFHKEELSNLAISEKFSIVKEWILNNASQGQFLGERPKCGENSQLDEEIRRIIYELMNIGIIVQNGNYNYHITSYFHFLEFLNEYHEPYEEFLKLILHNKYFKLMCGFHSGFGYTFENIFTSALIINGIKNQQGIPFNLKLNQLKALKILKEKVIWSEFRIEQNILYQTPTAAAIDGFVLQGDNLILIQITTANPPNPLKIDSLISEMEGLLKIKLRVEKKVKIFGWLVSLFEFKKEISPNKKLFITSGDQLVTLLGNELHAKLKAVKNSFSKIK